MKLRYVANLFMLIVFTGIFLFGCQQTREKTPIRGENGSTLKIAWSSTHERPELRFWEDSRVKVGIAVDSKQNVYFLDKVVQRSKSGRGFWLRKYRPNGSVAWTIKQMPDNPDRILPQAVTVDSRDNVIVVATAQLKNRGSGVFIEKFLPTGRRVWQRLQNIKPQPGLGAGFMIAIDRSDGIYVCGAIDTQDNSKPWLAKYLPNGKFVWERIVPIDTYFSQSAALKMTITNDVVTVIPSNGSAYGYDVSGNPAQPEDRGETDILSNGGFAPTEPGRSIPGEPGRVLEVTGPKGYIYHVRKQLDGLDVWVEILRRDAPNPSAAALRASVLRAPQKPGQESLDPRYLTVDKLGNAYLVILDKRAKMTPVARLIKLDITLPKIGPDTIDPKLRKEAKNLLRYPPESIATAVENARRRLAKRDPVKSHLTAEENKALVQYLSDLLPIIKDTDKANQIAFQSIKKFVSGDKKQFINYVAKANTTYNATSTRFWSINVPKPALRMHALMRNAIFDYTTA